MLSPGKWHELVPKDPVKNMEFRKALLERAACDPEFQEGLLQICAQDILFWINCFVYQTNPNKVGKDAVGPFITWGFQDRAINSQDPDEPGVLWCVENREDLLVQKSREMGATWIFMMVEAWLCRFKPNVSLIMISKSAKAVDGPGHQSLFGKIRFIHEYLPHWMLNSESEAQLTDQVMFMGWTETASSVTGQASTGRAGVSERGTAMFIDEYPQIEEDWEVLYRTAATTQCRMFNGTHMGTGTAFYSLSQSDDIKQMKLHWTQHPEKNQGLYRWNPLTFKLEFLVYRDNGALDVVESNGYEYPPDFEFDMTGNPTGGPFPGVRSPWYDREFRRIGRSLSEMAKDQDINPSGSVSQFYNPLVIRELLPLCREPLGEYEFVDGRLNAVVGGKIKLWCALDHNGRPPLARYGAGVDVSGGTGCTPSCLSIINSRTGEKVLEFMDPEIDPKDFGVLAVALCQLFRDEDGNGAKLAWEHHGPGIPFGLKVFKELKYMRVYCNRTNSKIAESPSDTPGFYPQATNRLLLHSDYRMALAERKVLNRSKHAVKETLNFKHDGKGSVEHTQYMNRDNPAAGRENHGDIVVADALGWLTIKDVAEVGEPERQVALPGTLAYLFEEEDRRKLSVEDIHPTRSYGAIHGRRNGY